MSQKGWIFKCYTPEEFEPPPVFYMYIFSLKLVATDSKWNALQFIIEPQSSFGESGYRWFLNQN